jgi:hypothetical protein
LIHLGQITPDSLIRLGTSFGVNPNPSISCVLCLVEKSYRRKHEDQIFRRSRESPLRQPGKAALLIYDVAVSRCGELALEERADDVSHSFPALSALDLHPPMKALGDVDR